MLETQGRLEKDEEGRYRRSLELQLARQARAARSARTKTSANAMDVSE